MSDYVRNYISNCQRCVQFRQAPQVAELQTNQCFVSLTSGTHGFPSNWQQKGEKYQCVDCKLTTSLDYAQAYVTNDQTAATVVKVFIDKICKLIMAGQKKIPNRPGPNASKENSSKLFVVRPGLER